MSAAQPGFDIIPGDVESPVIIHVPHASRVIPDDVQAGLALTDEIEHELDLMTDSFTDVIARQVADRAAVRPWLFVNRLSRLVVDPERFPDDREEMNAVGMGAVYSRTSSGEVLRHDASAQAPALVDRFFTPYTTAFAELVDTRVGACGEVTIIDLHSFPLEALPYELHGDGPRPEICLGTDPFHTTDHLTYAAQTAFADFEVGQDSPFSGCYVPMGRYGVDRRVQALMVELRRDLYMDDSFQLVDPAIEPAAAALTTLVDTCDLQLVPFRTCHGMFLVDEVEGEG